jgi:hypothetical protein
MNTYKKINAFITPPSAPFLFIPDMHAHQQAYFLPRILIFSVSFSGQILVRSLIAGQNCIRSAPGDLLLLSGGERGHLTRSRNENRMKNQEKPY